MLLFQVIEELAEWIVHAFDRYQDASPYDRLPVPTQPPKMASDPSPLTSETETDDSGITFVPKRHGGGASPPQRPAFTIVDREKGESSGSDVTLLDDIVRLAPEKVASSTPWQQHHTISETELLRRRRLLDGYIFEKEV